MLAMEEVEENCWVFHWDEKYRAADPQLDKAIDAWEAGYCERAEDIPKRLLRQFPLHIDALHHLAVFYSQLDLHVEAYMAAQAAVSVGFRTFPNRHRRGVNHSHAALSAHLRQPRC